MAACYVTGSSPRSLVGSKKDLGQLQVSHAVSLAQDGLFGKACNVLVHKVLLLTVMKLGAFWCLSILKMIVHLFLFYLRVMSPRRPA